MFNLVDFQTAVQGISSALSSMTVQLAAFTVTLVIAIRQVKNEIGSPSKKMVSV